MLVCLPLYHYSTESTNTGNHFKSTHPHTGTCSRLQFLLIQTAKKPLRCMAFLNDPLVFLNEWHTAYFLVPYWVIYKVFEAKLVNDASALHFLGRIMWVKLITKYINQNSFLKLRISCSCWVIKKQIVNNVLDKNTDRISGLKIIPNRDWATKNQRWGILPLLLK